MVMGRIVALLPEIYPCPNSETCDCGFCGQRFLADVIKLRISRSNLLRQLGRA
jgi:hypothetical protein